MNATVLEKRISQLEKKAENLNARMTHLLTNAGLGVLLVRGDTVQDYNKKAAELLGIRKKPSKKLLLGSLLQPPVTGDQPQLSELSTLVHKALKGKEQRITLTLNGTGKTPVTSTVSFHAINAEEELIQVLIRENQVPEKVTKPKQEHTKDLPSLAIYTEQNYREIFNTIDEGIFLQDIRNGRVIDANKTLLEMFNSKYEDIINRVPDGFSSGIPPFNKENANKFFFKAVKEGECHFEWHSRKQTGELFWTEIHHKRVNISGESLVLSVVRDITLQKSVEEKLKLSEGRFKNFVDLNTDVILYVTIDPPMDISLSTEDQLKYLTSHTFCSEINAAFRNLRSDISVNDLIGKPLYFMYKTEFKDTRPFMFGRHFIESGYRIINMETRYEEEDELHQYYQNTLIGVVQDKKLHGFWMTMRNISELKIAEKKLHYKTSLDQLISNISTRFINLPPESIDINIESAFGEICKITDSDAGFLFLFSAAGDTFSLSHLWQNEKVLIHQSDYIDLPLSEVRYILDELEKNGLMIIPSKAYLLTEQSLRWANNAQHVESIIIKPVIYQGNLVGMMGLAASVQNFQWKEDDSPMLKVISEIFINAIQRKNAEKALMDSEQNYREIFNATFEAILIFNPETEQITDVNHAFLELFDYSYEEALQCSPGSLSAVKADFTSKRILKLIRDESINDPRLVEWLAKRKNGEKFWTELSVQSAELGGEKKILAVIREITDRKEAQEALMKSEERFRSILQFLTDIIWIVDQNLIISYESPSSSTVMGYGPGYLTGKKGTDFIHPDDLPLVYKDFAEVLEKANDFIPTEFRARHADGHYIRLEAIANNLLDHKAINGIVVTCRDVTERRKAELQLKESEEKFRVIFETALDGIFMMLEDRFVDCNPATLKLFGCTREQILGSQPYLFSPEKQPDGRDSKEKALEKISQAYQGIPQFFEWMHQRPDGSLFETEVSLNRIELGGMNYLQAIVRDITSRKASEKALKESEAKFRNIFDNSTDAILIVGEDFRIRVVNEIFLQRSGYKLDEITSMTAIDLLPEPHLRPTLERMKQMFAGKELSANEIEFVTRNKEVIPVEINSRVIDYEGSRAILSIIRDITERKQFEKRILDTIIMTEEKERENFAKNLHDEIGPLLSSIKMYINSLESARAKEKHEFIISQLKEIMKEAIQITKEISNDLSPHILSNYGLNAAIDSFINRLSHVFTVDYKTNLGSKRFHELVETSVYRIIKELVNNTLKHSQGNAISITIKYNRGVMDLIYTDNGIGLPAGYFKKKEPVGMGISNIISRARSLNAMYEFFTIPEGGMGFECKMNVEKNT